MAKLIILSGCAGVGKSTFRKTHYPENRIYSSDNYRETLFGSLAEGNKHNEEVFKTLYRDLHDDLKQNPNDTVIFDATNLNRKSRIGIYNNFKHLAEIHIVMLFEAKATIHARNQQRKNFARVPDYVVDRMYNSQQPPRVAVDCDSFEIITSETMSAFDIKNIKSLAQLESHVSPAIWQELALNFAPHETPYHSEDINTHIDETILRSTTDKLKMIALFHDLGKGLNKVVKDGIATYSGHANLGAMYAAVYLSQHPQPDNAEIIEAIYQHMQAFQGFTKKSKARYQLNDSDLETIMAFNAIDKASSHPQI